MTTPLFPVARARVVVINQALVFNLFIRFTVCCQIKDLYEQKPTRTQPNAAPFSFYTFGPEYINVHSSYETT